MHYSRERHYHHRPGLLNLWSGTGKFGNINYTYNFSRLFVYTLRATNKHTTTTTKVKYPHYRPTWLRGVQEVRAPRFHDTRHTKIVRSSLLRTGRLYPQEFLEAESTPGTWTCQMLRKKSPVTRPGIDPETFRLVAQRLNHYYYYYYYYYYY